MVWVVDNGEVGAGITSLVLVARPMIISRDGLIVMGSFHTVFALASFISQQIATYTPAYFFQLDERDEISLLD